MATDYGLYCQRCDSIWITDNVGKDEADDIIKDVHNFAKLREVMDVLRFDLYLSTHFSSENSLDGLLDFAYLHHNHPLIHIDEYAHADWLERQESMK
jgi:hypothetical protein